MHESSRMAWTIQHLCLVKAAWRLPTRDASRGWLHAFSLIKSKKEMKKNYFSSLLSFLMIAVCATTFVACGDDHEDDGINTIQQEVMNKLAGTWQRVERGFDDVTYNDIIEITFSKYGAVSYTYVNYSSSSTKTFKTRTSNGTYTISNDGTYITSYSCYELNPHCSECPNTLLKNC